MTARRVAIAVMSGFVALALAVIMFAQTPGAGTNTTKYTPTEVQSLRLKVAQQQAIIARQDLQAAQQRYQESIANLTSEGEKVRAENKWPEAVRLNLDSLTYAPVTPPKER